MTKTSEQELIRRAQSGDAHAFEALINQYYETMFKFAYKYCGNRQNAEDITQESCIRLARFIGSFRNDSAFTSWLYRLVINTAKDWFRSNRYYGFSEDGLEDLKIESNSHDRLYAKQVLETLYKLTDAERETIVLVFAEGLTHREAGEILGCKESTISGRIHEARKKLTALFEEEQQYG